MEPRSDPDNDQAAESVAEPLWLARDVADTVEFLTANGMVQTLLRASTPRRSNKSQGPRTLRRRRT
jgi:hypothetical protein